MWCLWALPLLGLAVRVSSEDTPTVSCNGTSMIVQPPLWVKMYKDEAHFVCSTGYKLQGQKVLTCITNNWNHEVPTCEKFPRTLIKMKCPYDHRERNLSNLNLISTWINQNTDQVLILNSDFIDESPESQRLAAEMLARFNDPFFRFYADLPTSDKGLPMPRLIARFQESKQFLELRKKMREDFADFDFNDIDEDENVLFSFYGAYFTEVLEDMISPYSGLIPKVPDTELPNDLTHATKHLKPQEQDTESFLHASQETTSEWTLPVHASTDFPESSSSIEDGFPAEPLFLEPLGGISVSGEQSLKKNVKRARGDVEKLLPPKNEGSDFFNRPVNQVLVGTKALEQSRLHRDSYLNYIKTIVKHIVDYRIPKNKWPESLRKYDLQELLIILEIPSTTTPENPECSPPWTLGFELVSNGTAMLDGARKVVNIRCNPGFELRGASELFCDRGRWVPRGAGMPTCVGKDRPALCSSTAPRLLNGRVIKAELDFVVYECLPGYKIEGTNMLLCKDGRWTPSIGDYLPVCRELQQPSNNCGPPPTPVNGGATAPHFLSDGRRFVVRYFCYANHSMEGADYSICVNGQWTPYNFRCLRGGVDNVPSNTEMPQEPRICPKLVVPNASVKYYEDGRGSVRVTCLPGYRMDGSALVYCENGTFLSSTPTCVDRLQLEPCSAAIAPVYGSVKYVTDSAVRFSCDPGYTLVGKDRAVCYEGRWSDPTPQCVLRGGGACDNNDQLLNKNLVGYVYNNGRWLECVERVELIGNHHQYCRNGRWDPEPTCPAQNGTQKTSILYSEFIDCPLPEVSPSNGVTISSRGRKIYYRCKYQDGTLRGQRTNECVGGRWLHPAAYCEPRSGVSPAPTSAPQRGCQAVPIRGGEGYIYSEGRVVLYQCKLKYLIRGQTTLRCERSQWSTPLPSCYDPGQSLIQEDGELIYDSQSCPLPPSFPGTTFMILNRGLRIAYYCSNGNVALQDCVNGRWSGDVPGCASSIPTGVCEPQEIQNGKFFQYGRSAGLIQCKANYVIENTKNLRTLDARCNPDNGQWSFGVIPPRCVPEAEDVLDDRPIDVIDDSVEETRLQIEECGPPQVTNFTVDKSFYIKNKGTSIVFGCKKARAKRQVASLDCIEGVWGYTASGTCDPACGLDDVRIENGVKVIYDDNEYVFQCLKNYDLIGVPVAHCPDYQPNAVYSTSVVQKFGPFFKAPECRATDRELRPISGDDVLDSDASQPCSWLSQFGKDNLKPEDYFISDRGRLVTWRSDGKEKSALCRGGMWADRQMGVEGCVSLPSEPEQGTFFVYEDTSGTSVYFQCLDGYRLYGKRVSSCGASSIAVPECILDSTAPRGPYPKVNNPNPVNSVRCSKPPESLPNAEITIHYSGEMFAISCNPGFSIENSRQKYSIIRCNQYSWDPATLPRCLRDGDRTPLPRPGGRHDLFGRRLPQELTGEKAARQDEQLREQFRQHARQLVDFAKARNRELRRSGVPPERLPIERLPIVSTITDEERDQLFRKNEDTYREIENLLQSIREERGRQRRAGLKSSLANATEIHVPYVLLPLEAQIRKYNLTSQDVSVMVMLDGPDRLKFLEDKRVQQEKSKSDPIESRSFVRKALAAKKKQSKKNSVEELQMKSAEVSNSIEPSKKEDVKTASSTESETPSAGATTSETTQESTETTVTEGEVTSTEEATSRPEEVSEVTPVVADDLVSPKINGSAEIETPSNTRKGYDNSCSRQFAKAPEIENGYLVSYDEFDGKDGKLLEAKYRCDEGFYFEFEHTNKVRCRNGEWVGELPTCIAEPESEEDEEEDQDVAGSQMNKLE